MSKALTLKSFLPQQEVEICQRVREIRLTLKWSQPDFAKELGLSRVRLASYEYAKAPIRYSLGTLICDRFGISQRWLAEGKQPMRHYLRIRSSDEAGIKRNMLFSLAYDKYLKPLIEEDLVHIAAFLSEKSFAEEFKLDPHDPLPEAFSEDFFHFSIAKVTKAHLSRLPENLRAKYHNTVLTAAIKFCEEHAKVMDVNTERKRDLRPKRQ